MKTARFTEILGKNNTKCNESRIDLSNGEHAFINEQYV